MSPTHPLAKDLARMLGRAAVLTDPADLLVYECDAMPFQKLKPGMVVLPTTAQQVSSAAGFLYGHSVPFLARGAGTGLSGSAVPVDEAVVISLSRMNRILRVDPHNRRMTVEAGAVNLALSQHLAPLGWQFAPDPSSQMACTIGGNIAHNAGGPHGLKYGVTADHVLGVEFVLPDGEILDLGGSAEEPVGYDLRGLVTGSEGTLGIVTKAILRITPLPQATRTALAVFDAMDSASAAVAALVASGTNPAALEMIDNLMIRAFEAGFHFGLPVEAAAILIVEFQGLEAGLDDDLEQAVSILRRLGAASVHVSQDEHERQALWKVRKSAGGSMGHFTPSYYTLDGCVPPSKVPEILRTFVAIGRKHGLRVGNSFHAGDGNMHPYILYDDRDQGERTRAFEAGHEMLEACLAVGGTITGEHGVGLEKVSLMPLMFSAEDLALMKGVRSVFDPKSLCNPGKILPAELPPAKAARRAEPAPAPSDLAAAAVGLVGRAHVLAGAQLEPLALDGLRPRAAVFPASQGQVAQIMEWADARGVSVVPRGGGTSWGLGNPPRSYDLALCTERLSGMIAFRPQDLTVTAQAGLRISALQEALARSGQFLPLDPPLPDRATIGGAIAADAAGPLRCCRGPVRSLLLQVTAVLPGGLVIKSGAPVAKSVAGYDFRKLLTGSMGTLGVIVSATLRTAPLPRSSVAVAACFNTASRAAEAAAQVGAGEVSPAFVELLSPAMAAADVAGHLAGRHCVLAGAHGNEAAVAWQRERLLDIFRESGADSVEPIPDAQACRRSLADLHHAGGISCRAILPPAALAGFLWHTESGAESGGIELAYICHAASGIADIHVRGESQGEQTVTLLERLRAAARDAGGRLVLTSAPVGIKNLFSPWGEPDGSLRLAQGLKQVFDPNGMLSPGRFVGGI